MIRRGVTRWPRRSGWKPAGVIEEARAVHIDQTWRITDRTDGAGLSRVRSPLTGASAAFGGQVASLQVRISGAIPPRRGTIFGSVHAGRISAASAWALHSESLRGAPPSRLVSLTWDPRAGLPPARLVARIDQRDLLGLGLGGVLGHGCFLHRM